MSPSERTPLHGSVVALALTGLALGVSLLLRPYLEPDIFLLFVVAVWLSAWYYGRLFGMLATGASAFALLYFFVGSSTPLWAVAARLGAFLVTASLITWVTAAWRESRRMLASTLASIGDAVVATDREGRITFLNAVAETLTGWSGSEARNKPVEDVLQLFDETSRQPVENPLTRALRDRTVVTAAAHVLLVSRSGTDVPIEHNAAPVRGVTGKLEGAILVFRDTSKRRQFEEQATHVQKMDAVGRLAGGVAGDFNNMLTVITGYAELLRAENAPGSRVRQSLDEIVYAGERAATLTRHLLAFSRGAAAQARPIDLNALLGGMEPMLRRLLGQNIELMLLTSARLDRVHADSAQMEQVVVNLATNARDAMPAGGKLVIETANVNLDELAAKHIGGAPGSYVMLAVSDTGSGMDAETRSRLFEPFFTTKAPGKGSGLGLSTVYGAVRQADGYITVYSQPNAGTIFEVYLPRATEQVAEPVRRRSAKGSETILLVDDEEGVRKLCCTILQANGYDVLEAGNGAAAVAAFEKNAHKIGLLLTDVVMPQFDGFELATKLGELSPSLKVLYMSGYRQSGETPAAFLHKPFTPDALLAKVRDVLDAETV
jgi:two-component system, cell cycle sensor histidine kinase and response regulator CckA